MNVPFRLDPPRPSSAFVSRDPRFLVVLFAAVAVSTFLIGRSLGLVLVLAYVVALYAVSGLPLRALATRARSIAFFAAFIVAINAFLVNGAPLPRPFSYLSREGIAAGLYYALRVAVLYFAIVLFLSLAPREGVAGGLAALVRPFSRGWSRRVALHGFLYSGYLPLFGEELNRIRLAQGFRGGGIEGGFLHRIAGARALLVPLIVSAIHRAGQLAMAVELRGIRFSIDRVVPLDAPRSRDFVFAGMTLLVLLTAWWL
jgi:energy-coupling factor transport system permease protein